MHSYDFSRGASTLQSAFFAAWGACQLVVGSLAFQRGGFVYGLGVLLFGVVAFCAAIFVVHRCNRQRLSIGDVGIALEQGPFHACVYPWSKIARIRRRQQCLELVLKEGPIVQLFYIEWDEDKKTAHFAELWADLQARGAEKHIAIEGY